MGRGPARRLYSDHKPLLRPINALTEPAPAAAHSNLAHGARFRRTLLPTLIQCKRYRKAMRPARNSSAIVYILRHVTKLRCPEIWPASTARLRWARSPSNSRRDLPTGTTETGAETPARPSCSRPLPRPGRQAGERRFRLYVCRPSVLGRVRSVLAKWRI